MFEQELSKIKGDNEGAEGVLENVLMKVIKRSVSDQKPFQGDLNVG